MLWFLLFQRVVSANGPQYSVTKELYASYEGGWEGVSFFEGGTCEDAWIFLVAWDPAMKVVEKVCLSLKVVYGWMNQWVE